MSIYQTAVWNMHYTLTLSDEWSDARRFQETSFSAPDLPSEDQFDTSTLEVWEHFHSMPTQGDQSTWNAFFHRQDALEDPSLVTASPFMFHQLRSPLAGSVHQNLDMGLGQSHEIEIVKDGGHIAEIQPSSSITQSRELLRNSDAKGLLKHSVKKTESLFKAKPVQRRIPHKPEIKIMPKFFSDDVQFKCPLQVCRKIFKKKADLRDHVLGAHPEQKQLFNVLFKSTLKVDKKFPCPKPDCLSGFSRAYALNQHLKDKHKTGEPTKMVSSLLDKPYACPSPGCSSSYSLKRSLRRHITIQH